MTDVISKLILKDMFREEGDKMDFDDLPEIRKPNPLPCGCAIVGVCGINISGTRSEYRDSHIRFCPTHAAAPDLLEALEKLLDMVTDSRLHGDEVDLAAEAIYKARGE